MENQKIFFGSSREFSGNYRRNHSGGGVLGGGALDPLCAEVLNPDPVKGKKKTLEHISCVGQHLL